MPTAQETQDRLTRVETRVGLRHNAGNLRPFEHEPSIPIVAGAQVLATFPEDGVTTVVVGWETPDNPDFETVEFFVKDLSSNAGGTVKVGESRESPATLVLTADANSAKTIFLRTKMRNGLGSDLGASPTVTATINKLEITGDSLADNSIENRHMTDAAIGNAEIQNAAITSAKIVSLEATKITAGTLQTGVIYSGTINTNQINAGTINGVNVNAGTYTLISANQQFLINSTDGMYQHDTLVNQRIQIRQGRLESRIHSTGTLRYTIDQTGFHGFNFAGTVQEAILSVNISDQGFLSLNQGGNLRVTASADGGSEGLQNNSGHLGLNNSSTVRRVNLGTDTSDRGVLGLTASGGIGTVLQAGNSSTAGLFINGVKVVGVQQSDPGAGITLADVRSILLAHGLIG